MEQFKVGVGFAVLATAVWLFWFTATRIGKDGVLWFGLFLVLVSFIAWLWGQFVQRATKFSPVVGVMLVVAVVFGYGFILENKLDWRHYSSAPKEGIDWQKWSPEEVAKALRAGHPVLVDFTSDGCLSCKANKFSSLEIRSTREKLKSIDAVAFIADYTDESPVIGREIARHGRSDVPVVLVYPGIPNAEAMVLPTMLTPAIVLTHLEKAAKLTRAAKGQGAEQGATAPSSAKGK
jgi:thiol:disulfide interchange protein DsbD